MGQAGSAAGQNTAGKGKEKASVPLAWAQAHEEMVILHRWVE